MTTLGAVDHNLEHKKSLEPKAACQDAAKTTSIEENGKKHKPTSSSISNQKEVDSKYDYETRYSMHIKEDKDQAMVQTPFGKGLVVRTRKHPNTNQIVSRDIELTDWKLAPPKKGPPRPAMLHSATQFPSIPAEVGNDVTCLYGRGRVMEVRPEQVVVQLSSWRLTGRSKITCVIQKDQVQVVRPKLVYEMNVFERVEHAKKLKEEAKNIFAKKEYERALSKYALAVDAVRYVQHQKDSTNEVRADLLVVMITSCNNAATCAASEKKWDLVARYAKNALVLIEALEERQTATKTTRVFDILTKEGFGAVKIFGEWKGKSLLFLAKAQAEKQNYSEALDMCKEVEEVVSKHMKQEPSNKVLLQHEKENKRIHAACKARKQLQLKKEKQRAQAMFGGKKESPAKEKANGNKPALRSGGNEETKETVNGKKNLMDDSSKTRKSVSFEDGGKPRDAYEKPKKTPSDDYEDEEDDLSMPWYEEHQELMVLVAGLAVVGFGARLLLSRWKRS